MNRDRKKFWGKSVSICIGLYAISICPAHGQILQKCYQGQFNFKALSQRGTENGRDRRRRERSEPGDLQGRACCRAERACGIGIRDEDTPPRGNAASSGTRSASAAFCVQNTGGSGYRQDRASVIRRPRKQCFAERSLCKALPCKDAVQPAVVRVVFCRSGRAAALRQRMLP